MKQDSTTIDPVVHAFKLSEDERQFLLGAEKGEGLYFCRNSRVPLRVVASHKEHALAGTTAQERSQAEAEKAARQAPLEAFARQDRAAAIPPLQPRSFSSNGASGSPQEREIEE